MNSGYLAVLALALAIGHSFFLARFERWSRQFPTAPKWAQILRLLSEVEVVFSLYAGLYLLLSAAFWGLQPIGSELSALSFTEPLFVFAVLMVGSNSALLSLARRGIESVANILPLPNRCAFYFAVLTVGPWLGSYITEPAAMTVTAWLLRERVFCEPRSTSFLYGTLGLLFVNVSIGGTLTAFAAPPVLMVAGTWGWDNLYMMAHFGWKAILASAISTGHMTWYFKSELKRGSSDTNKHQERDFSARDGLWNLTVLAALVSAAHHPLYLVLIFSGFILSVLLTSGSLKSLQWRSAFMVSLFLAAIVILGPHQRIWLTGFLANINSMSLYLGAIGLTAVIDNAALTSLAGQVPNLSTESRYILVAGAVVGGGLSVIANAPNPIGFYLLSPIFGPAGVSPFKLILGALVPTLITAFIFWSF